MKECLMTTSFVLDEVSEEGLAAFYRSRRYLTTWHLIQRMKARQNLETHPVLREICESR